MKLGRSWPAFIAALASLAAAAGACGKSKTAATGGATDSGGSVADAGGQTGSGGGKADAGGQTGSGGADAGPSIGASVLQHHLHATRDGFYRDAALTKAAVAGMAVDPTFAPTLDGAEYAQPLYVENGPGGKGTFYFVTENDSVYAVDETTGSAVWTRNVGPAAAKTGSGCGNIAPLGITGTPAIDLGRRAIYFDAVLATGVGGTIKTHLVHALSLDDGSELAGWPVDVSTLQHGSLAFDPVAENQRGAVVIAGSTLYVPYSGHASDCPHNGVYYHGWVIGVPLDDPAGATAWATGAQQSGIWGPGGLASDGAGVFAVTGNAGDMETAQTPWQHQEAILRFQAGPVFSGQTADYFAPFNWAALDANDLDLGGSGVLLVDVPGATPSQIAVAFGKDGKAYLADRTNLGGIGPVTGGPPVLVSQVAGSQIIGAPAWYTTASGVYVTLVVYNGQQTAGGCPAGQSGDLMALKIVPGAPPTLTTAWCQNSNGHGSPTVTAAGGDTLVWTVGAETTGHLYAFDGDTGAPVYTSKETMPQLTRFIVPIAVHGRIIVGGNGKAYAFKP